MATADAGNMGICFLVSRRSAGLGTEVATQRRLGGVGVSTQEKKCFKTSNAGSFRLIRVDLGYSLVLA